VQGHWRNSRMFQKASIMAGVLVSPIPFLYIPHIFPTIISPHLTTPISFFHTFALKSLPVVIQALSLLIVLSA
jgi:hypothetical protein